jgi:transcriptional regulator with XRE-family HTH domain
MATPLKAARLARGWSKPELVTRMRQVAAALGEALPKWTSLRVQLAQWENGHHQP